MTLFDAKTVELKGLNLIEASAGTGKTYTLAELYCRLVVEKQLEVKQILVVTYTRAATEELRGRLRKKLVEQRERLSKEPEPDSKAIKRLKLAIQSFDEAAIFTIHGFCQRALQDFAFESGYSFDMEMITDEEELKQAVVDDFWRRYISTADPDFARFLLNKKQTPETLLSAVGGLPGKPYLNHIPVPEVDSTHLQEQIEEAFAQLKQLWPREAEQVSAFVRDTSNMKQNSYKLEKVEQWLIQLDALVAEEKAPIGLFKDFYRFTFNEIKTKGLKKNVELPQLLFWSVCETLHESDSALSQAYEVGLQRLRLQLADYLKTELPQRKQQLKLQAFDDLLLNLQHALHAEQGNKLAVQIRQQFRAALIDEFQDTDPVQYDCFKTIFADSDNPVFFVGDPKQAIYSFRGADIFTYLKAKQASQREFNLDTNWRSHPSLVKAVNTLFEQVEKPFIYDDIPFLPVMAARPDHAVLEVNKQPVSPLEFAWIQPDNDKAISVTEMQNRAANMTATQIAELIQHAANGKATLTEEGGSSRALNGGDIAVLVRNHIQATAIQQALRQRGINSVQQSRENVFQSEQAVMLEHVLLAIAQPGNDSLIATALATPLFAKSALQIYLLQQDDMKWLQQSDFFQLLHETWRQSGFIVMFRFLLEQLDVRRRLLQQADGERQLTNLMHLAELVQAYARSRNSTMEAILTWLAAQRQASASAPDTAQIRLESDEQLVKVITIHTSKGLEYPLVFCPFLWHQRRNNKADLRIFHRGDSHEAYVAFAEPGLSEAQPIAEQEAKAEELRLLYVALTRARERCVILWGPAKNSENTALFSLLHQQLNKTDATQMYADLSALAQQSPQYISLQQAVSQDVQSASAVNEADELAARQFKGNIITPWQVGSFSGLSRGHSVEQPDYDADTSSTDWLQTQEKRRDRFGFPRGANAGVCLHSLFENWSFQPTASDWPQLIHKTLKQYGIADDWADVVDSWLQDVVKTPLDKSNALKLEAITTDKRLDEMAFYFPVNHLTVKRLKTALKPFYIEMPVLEKVLAQLSFNDLTGFMKGFIDLVFEFEGRFYIADYKSNWLGERPEDYNAESLNEAMVQHGYPLQYLIYSLALHRYLKIRMPDYNPEQNFGGVYYLFIRGMQPEWGQAGVYFDKPSSALLQALDNCIQEVGHD